MISSKIHKTIINADGMPSIVHNIRLSGEPFVPEVADRFPNGHAGTPISLHAYENVTLQLEAYRLAYNQYWESTQNRTGTGRPVDAVIFPVGPHTATLPGKSYWWSEFSQFRPTTSVQLMNLFFAAYTSVLNVLDYCAVVIPVTHADAKIDIFDSDHEPLSDKDELNWKACKSQKISLAPEKVISPHVWLNDFLDDPEIFDGAPANVMIVGRRIEEEKVLAVAQVVVDALASAAHDKKAKRLNDIVFS